MKVLMNEKVWKWVSLILLSVIILLSVTIIRDYRLVKAYERIAITNQKCDNIARVLAQLNGMLDNNEIKQQVNTALQQFGYPSLASPITLAPDKSKE